MAATFSPRYSVSTAAPAAENFSRTSSTTATSSGRGVSIRTSSRFSVGARAEHGHEPSETSEVSASSGGLTAFTQFVHARFAPDVFSERSVVEASECTARPLDRETETEHGKDHLPSLARNWAKSGLGLTRFCLNRTSRLLKQTCGRVEHH